MQDVGGAQIFSFYHVRMKLCRYAQAGPWLLAVAVATISKKNKTTATANNCNRAVFPAEALLPTAMLSIIVAETHQLKFVLCIQM